MAAAGGKAGLVASFGEMLIDFVPTEAGVSLADAPGFLKKAGGAPANVAIAVKRLGGCSAFIGKLGDDEFGRMLAGILRENGVDDQGVRFDGNARTALAFVTLRADGEREFMFYRNPSADMLLTPDELDLPLLHQGKLVDSEFRLMCPCRGSALDAFVGLRVSHACGKDAAAGSLYVRTGLWVGRRRTGRTRCSFPFPAKIFHYGSISLISEPCRSAHLRAMAVAKKAGALLSFDPNLRLPLWPSPDDARKMIFSIWEESEIIKVSDVELEFLTGDGSLEDKVALSLWHKDLKLLVVTLGDKGCKYYTKHCRGAVKSVKVTAVDTTGAGDAFVGALLKQISQDDSLLKDEKRLRKALAFANVCGAVTATKKGAIPSLPTEDQVLELLRGFEDSS
ncbi:putative fructokinase-2 [Nymphaea thermarum]|nr:putative fructokinase-2 [Nymphaea thermarum]